MRKLPFYENIAGIKSEKARDNMCIPFQLITYSYNKKIIGDLALFIYLKNISNGFISNPDKESLANDLGICKKTLQRRLNTLKELNWIGQNNNTLYVRSFEHIREIHDFHSRTAAVCDLTDFSKFKAFVAGTMISYMINQQKKKRRKVAVRVDLKSRQKRLRSYQARAAHSSYYPVAKLAISKYYSISLSSAFRLKKLAEVSGFVKIKKDRSSPLVKKALGELTSVELRNSMCNHFNHPDLFKSNMQFRMRKKMDTYKSRKLTKEKSKSIKNYGKF